MLIRPLPPVITSQWMAQNFYAGADAPTHHVFIGAGAAGDPASGKGGAVYRMEMDAATGKMHGAPGWRSEPAASFPGGGPWCTPSPCGRHLYIAVRAGEGTAMNYIAAFSIDPSSGALRPLGTSTTVLPGAPHCSVAPSGDTLACSMMAGGGAASFAVRSDGTLGPAATVIELPGGGSGVRMKPTFADGYLLQDQNMGHSAQMTMDGGHVLVPDIGADKVWAFALGPNGTLEPCATPFWRAHPGAGPRHLCCHPNGKGLCALAS